MKYHLSTGSLIVDKKFIPITGGGAIKIYGACFLLQDVKVICRFEHATTIGRIISSDSALCPLPLFTRLGQHLLWLSEDNGITFNSHAVINIGKIYNLYIHTNIVATWYSSYILCVLQVILMVLVLSCINFNQALWAQVIAYLIACLMLMHSLEVIHDIPCIPSLTSWTRLLCVSHIEYI